MFFTIFDFALVLIGMLAKCVDTQCIVTANSIIDYDCATYLYFGPQGVSVNASAIVLDRKELCQPTAEKVSGKIVVVGDWSGISCNLNSLGDLYRGLDRAGAIGMVYNNEIQFAFPGFEAYLFESMNRCEYCDFRMVMVQIDNRMSSYIQEMRTSSDLFILLAPPKMSPFVELYRSWLWTLAMRVFLPGVALTTAALATGEMNRVSMLRPKEVSSRTYNEPLKISFAICALESLCMLVFGISLSAGQYGPFSLPIHVTYLSYSTFLGSGTLVTFILGLYLREECLARCSPGHLKRCILIQFRALIICVGTMCLFLDLFLMVISLFFHYWNERYRGTLLCYS
jgi:hypothetical protein